MDGISVYRYEKGEYREEQPKRAYKLAVRRDALGDSVVGGEIDSSLPLRNTQPPFSQIAFENLQEAPALIRRLQSEMR